MFICIICWKEKGQTVISIQKFIHDNGECLQIPSEKPKHDKTLECYKNETVTLQHSHDD